MVVCKFFREGNCRYGNNCRFEHSYSSRYSYHAPSSPVAPITQPATAPTVEQLVNSVNNDIRAAVNGKQWLLSSYGPFSKKNFPGFSDVSPEEVRLAVYEAKANNNCDEVISTYNNLLQEVNSKLSRLMNPDTSIIKTITSVYQQENTPDPFANSSVVGRQSASGIFGGKSTTNVFGQTNPASPQSVFGQSSASSVFGGQTNGAQNVFGRQNNSESIFGGQISSSTNVFGGQTSNAQSVFGGKSTFGTPGQCNVTPQSVFGSQSPQPTPQNVFGGQNSSPTPQSIFGGQNNSNNVFGSSAQNAFASLSQSSVHGGQQNVFGQNSSQTVTQSIFGQPISGGVSLQAEPNVFGKTENVFNQNCHSPFEVQIHSTEQSDCYSKTEELSEEDLEQYIRDSFEFGFIPELSPPQTLCF